MNNFQSESEISFDKSGGVFMGAQATSTDCQVGLFGVPYDGTTSFKPGTRFGPASIREVSHSLETYCPQLDLDLKEIKFTDFGSLEIPFGAPEPVIKAVEKSTKEIFSLGLKPLLLGGEHSITAGAVCATAQKYSELILVQLDAHADLRDQWLGNHHSHACAMRRCLDVLPSKNLFQFAIRSGTREEFNELHHQNRLVPHTTGKPANDLKQALSTHFGKPIYLTIDLDWFDPSVLPGTGTPEPGGFFWQDFAAVIDVLRNHHLVGADIVELAPILDSSGISSVLAAKVTRTLLMLLGH